MKKSLTELVFILDRSGSMAGLESDTIGGFNSLIAKEKQRDGECIVSTVLFDHESLVLHDRVPIGRVNEMTSEDYRVRGSTALLDAVGSAIKHISTVHRYARDEDVPEHTVFVITTDGMENASRRYAVETVRTMINERKEKAGWEFLFLGANIDAVGAAHNIGISADRAANFLADSEGVEATYCAVSDAVGEMRACASISGTWKNKVDRDFKSRRKK